MVGVRALAHPEKQDRSRFDAVRTLEKRETSSFTDRDPVPGQRRKGPATVRLK